MPTGIPHPDALRVARAASELFLDTEVRWSIPWIAAEARASGLTWDSTDGLFQHHLVPALVGNLYEVAGDWAGFPEEWLAAILLTPPVSSPPAQPPALRARWSCVRSFFDWPQLPEHWPVFQALARLVFEKRWELNGSIQRLLEVDWDLLDGLYREVFEPRFRGLRVSSDASPERTAAHWRWLKEFHAWIRLQPPGTLEVCRELEYVFRVPHLAKTPRGPMVVAALQPQSDRLADCLQGPLGSMSPPCETWEENLDFLNQRLGRSSQQTRSKDV